MKYRHNIPMGQYAYNGYTYSVSNNGTITRYGSFGSIALSKGFSLIACPMIAVHAIELKGLIRTYSQLSNCEIVAG